MAQGGRHQCRYMLVQCMLIARIQLSCSIRAPFSTEYSTTDSKFAYPQLVPRHSTLEFEVSGSARSVDGSGNPEAKEAFCRKQARKFTEVTVDAACPPLEPRFSPSQPEDIPPFLHFMCDHPTPLRRCYEVIPDGVGVNPNLMPCKEINWRTFTRLFWPSQGLLDWHGMRNRVPGTVGVVSPSSGWEWLATRKHGNCINCWSVSGHKAKDIEAENQYIRGSLGTVQFSGIRSMLDLGGGAGNIAAILNAAYNITVVSDNGDFGAPFLETIAARGLLSLSFNMKKRMPFVDGAFDAVHSRTTGVGDIETFLTENDRLVRPEGYIIMHGQCLLNSEGLENLNRTAARLALQVVKFQGASNHMCSHLVSAVYRKPEVRPAVPTTQGSPRTDLHGCDSLQCLCEERHRAWMIDGDQAGTCRRHTEATWHWISQHCLHLGVRIPAPTRCAARGKRMDLHRAARQAAEQPCARLSTLEHMDLPLSTDALRTVLDVEGDGRFVSDLRDAYGMQGMVLNSDLRQLRRVASRRVVGLQSSLNMRQPFGSGAFDMLHVRAKLLNRTLRPEDQRRAELEESTRRSMSGDLSTPAPLPNLHEFIYEMDRLVRPGGFVVVSFDEEMTNVHEIFNATVTTLGWSLHAKTAEGLAYSRPSQRSEQHA